DAEQAVPGAVDIGAQHGKAGGEDAVGKARRVAELVAARADAKIGVLELQHHRAPGEMLFLQPVRDLFAQRPQNRHELVERIDVAVEGGLGGDALDLAVAANRAAVDTPGEVVEPVAHAAVAAQQVVAFHVLQLADGADAIAVQRFLEYPADTPDQADRLVSQEVHGLLAADDGKAARLAQI